MVGQDHLKECGLFHDDIRTLIKDARLTIENKRF